jgi:hypothetical protein
MTVVGVAAAGFHGVEVGRAIDLFVPLAMQETVLPVWGGDAALVSCDEGDFVAWFDRTSITEQECVARAQTLPLGRVYEIADEARRRSELWMRFARCVEARAKKRR